MHLLHFVITRHFMAACQFLSDSTGPVLRTWIFSGRPKNCRFFFPERRKGTLPYVANDSCPAQTARPPRCHYGVDIVCIFFNDCGCAAAFAAAPRLCSHNCALIPHWSSLYINDLWCMELLLINLQIMSFQIIYIYIKFKTINEIQIKR